MYTLTLEVMKELKKGIEVLNQNGLAVAANVLTRRLEEYDKALTVGGYGEDESFTLPNPLDDKPLSR